eukprot:GHVN01037167.1.p1 GENE.GHVN01037167.1~~GHVN01037167.1.p1  ORF type:complete len:137 (+),score=12.27 GHVN01037167.1:680-1090(+)
MDEWMHPSRPCCIGKKGRNGCTTRTTPIELVAPLPHSFIISLVHHENGALGNAADKFSQTSIAICFRRGPSPAHASLRPAHCDSLTGAAQLTHLPRPKASQVQDKAWEARISWEPLVDVSQVTPKLHSVSPFRVRL